METNDKIFKARYALDEAAKPHRLMIHIAGALTSLSFDDLPDLYEFVAGVQVELSNAVAQAIAEIPEPADVSANAIDEEFLEELKDQIADLEREIYEITPTVNMYRVANAVQEFLNAMDGSEASIEFDSTDAIAEVDRATKLINTKLEEIAAERSYAERQNAEQAEGAELAMIKMLNDSTEQHLLECTPVEVLPVWAD